MKRIKLILAIVSMITVTAYAGSVVAPLLAAPVAPTSPDASNVKTGVPAANGEVRKIDKDARKITLKHGEIKNLDMPGMTMVFGVNDTPLLNNVKVGDNVKFTAEKINGSIVVTSIYRVEK